MRQVPVFCNHEPLPPPSPIGRELCCAEVVGWSYPQITQIAQIIISSLRSKFLENLSSLFWMIFELIFEWFWAKRPLHPQGFALGPQGRLRSIAEQEPWTLNARRALNRAHYLELVLLCRMSVVCFFPMYMLAHVKYLHFLRKKWTICLEGLSILFTFAPDLDIARYAIKSARLLQGVAESSRAIDMF